MEIIILIHLFLFQVPVQHQAASIAVETAGHLSFFPSHDPGCGTLPCTNWCDQFCMPDTDTDKVAEIFMKSLEGLKWDAQFVQEFNEMLCLIFNQFLCFSFYEPPTTPTIFEYRNHPKHLFQFPCLISVFCCCCFYSRMLKNVNRQLQQQGHLARIFVFNM